MLKRREVLLAGVTVLATGATASAADPVAAPAKDPAAAALANAAADCVRVGERCLQHCLDLLATGDASLGDCAKSVNQMLAVCKAVAPMADAGSKHLAALSRVCRDVCTDCEQVCRKHEGHHAICRECADACARVVSATQKISGVTAA